MLGDTKFHSRDFALRNYELKAIAADIKYKLFKGTEHFFATMTQYKNYGHFQGTYEHHLAPYRGGYCPLDSKDYKDLPGLRELRTP